MPGLLYPACTFVFVTRREGVRYLRRQGFRFDWARVAAYPVCFYRRPDPAGGSGDTAVLQPAVPFRIFGVWMVTVF